MAVVVLAVVLQMLVKMVDQVAGVPEATLAVLEYLDKAMQVVQAM